MISKIEYEILKELGDEWIEINKLAEKLNEDYYKVLRTAGFLKEKDLVEIKEETSYKYELTGLGRKYLEEGLPEEKIYNLIREKKEISINELKKYFDKKEIDYSIGLLRKLGIIEIKDGKVYFVKEGKIENKLNKIDELSEEEIREYEKRGLIKKKMIRNLYVKINENGRNILKEYKPEEYIEEYTKEVLDKKLYKNKKFRKYDIKIEVEKERIGKLNPYLEFLDELREELTSMGFEEMEDYSIIISHFWDLDSLFIPQDHPTGDVSFMDAYYLKYPKTIKDYPDSLFNKVKENNKKYFKVWNDEDASRAMLISHNTAISAKTLLKAKIPGRYFLIEKVFRNDTIDARHFIEFNQLEGIVLEKDANFLDLLGILEELIVNIVKAKEVKFYPAFFPFTEPSVEVYAKHPKLGWIEVGGAGVFREELLKPFEIDVPVLAWGLGIDRLAMIYLNIDDIRDLHTRNIKRLQD